MKTTDSTPTPRTVILHQDKSTGCWIDPDANIWFNSDAEIKAYRQAQADLVRANEALAHAREALRTSYPADVIGARLSDWYAAQRELTDLRQQLAAANERADRAEKATDTEIAQIEECVLEIERHCPCGARPETPQTHSHVIGCPTELALIKIRALRAAIRAAMGKGSQ